MANSYDAQLRAYVDLVEEDLPRRLWQGMEGRPYQPVLDAMRYSLLSGGKRIRAVMLLAFYRLFDEKVAAALPFAAAMEMVHAYSLIHDDLPCMDDDDTRRGKPACHIAFGEATALLAGDALLTLAFEVGASCPLPAARVLKATAGLAQAAGAHGMVGGQVMDLAAEGKDTDAADLDAINLRKTGALFQAAAGIGCCLGGATEEQQDAAMVYAQRVGLAFQIVDDLLDITADPALLGKPVGSDAQQGKNTYAAVYGAEKCRERIGQLNREAKQALATMGANIAPEGLAFLEDLADALAGRQF